MMRASAALEPVVLEGSFVRLDPMTLAHHAQLTEVGLDPEIWRLTVSMVRTPQEMLGYMESALELQREGRSVPFVTIERSSGRVVGSTRFGNYDPANRRIEIGWTWLAPPWQRTAINTEAKYLMLTHAFEKLHCVRVELKTDVLNQPSRNAMLRIGAKEEGVLRKHTLMWTGRYRDSIYYSILDEEWPDVKEQLKRMLVRGTAKTRA
ncbi:MAG TPA: GNAT family protein [Gemmatimonadaceae bacterium]|jgi:RimJ/RimL family protein N-acetyltransferase|nr:GNAT family protein [Gemmatimonadaceae bacterium]